MAPMEGGGKDRAEPAALNLFLEEVLRLPEVQLVEEGRFGERSLKVGGREFMHIHGIAVFHMLLPREAKAEVLARGLARQHPYSPGSGMVEFRLDSEHQLPKALRLARMSHAYVYSKVQRLKGLRAARNLKGCSQNSRKSDPVPDADGMTTEGGENNWANRRNVPSRG